MDGKDDMLRKAKQSKAKQSKAKQSKAKQSKAKQSKAKQSRAAPYCTLMDDAYYSLHHNGQKFEIRRTVRKYSI